MNKMNNVVEQEKQAVHDEWASGRQRILERHEALLAEEAAAAEADKECGYCGEKLGDCWGDHEEDDDCTSITSTEVRVNARILADELAKMNNALEQEKQAVHNEWASGRQRMLERHEALLAEEATKQLAERMRVQAQEAAEGYKY